MFFPTLSRVFVVMVIASFFGFIMALLHHLFAYYLGAVVRWSDEYFGI